MNKLLAPFFLLILVSCSKVEIGVSSDMEPLPEFYLIEALVEQDDVSDKDMESLAFRCLGLTKAIMNEEIKPKLEKEILIKSFFEKYIVIGVPFLAHRFSSARNIDLSNEQSNPQMLETLKEELPPIVQEYLRLMLENYKNAGNYFENNLLSNDINTCGPLYKEMGIYEND